jgi:hypothetical protein
MNRSSASAHVRDAPSFQTAFERYRLFAAEAWDATAMTINWPGLQEQRKADAAFRRACAGSRIWTPRR